MDNATRGVAGALNASVRACSRRVASGPLLDWVGAVSALTTLSADAEWEFTSSLTGGNLNILSGGDYRRMYLRSSDTQDGRLGGVVTTEHSTLRKKRLFTSPFQLCTYMEQHWHIPNCWESFHRDLPRAAMKRSLEAKRFVSSLGQGAESFRLHSNWASDVHILLCQDVNVNLGPNAKNAYAAVCFEPCEGGGGSGGSYKLSSAYGANTCLSKYYSIIENDIPELAELASVRGPLPDLLVRAVPVLIHGRLVAKLEEPSMELFTSLWEMKKCLSEEMDGQGNLESAACLGVDIS